MQAGDDIVLVYDLYIYYIYINSTSNTHKRRMISARVCLSCAALVNSGFDRFFSPFGQYSFNIRSSLSREIKQTNYNRHLSDYIIIVTRSLQLSFSRPLFARGIRNFEFFDFDLFS